MKKSVLGFAAALVAVTAGAWSPAIAKVREPNRTPVTRDHRPPPPAPKVTDHRKVPTINDHRKTATVNDHRKPTTTLSQRSGGGVAVTASATPRKVSKPKAPQLGYGALPNGGR